MAGVIAFIALALAVPAPDCGRAGHFVGFGALPRPVVSSVETVIEGVSLFHGGAASALPGSTLRFRADFGSRGPMAIFELRF